MKIIIPSQENSINSKTSEMFGRATFFHLFNVSNGKYKLLETIPNTFMNAKGGVGAMAAKMVAEKEVDVLIASNVGPRAKDALEKFDIKIVGAQETVLDSILNFIKKS